jgi:hypothetical protein
MQLLNTVPSTLPNTVPNTALAPYERERFTLIHHPQERLVASKALAPAGS